MAQRSVLLVDDDRLILDLYALALRQNGFVVHQASDTGAARVLAERMAPDVAVVDGRLARSLATAAGAELARELAQRGVPVVLFTNDQNLFDRPPPGVTARLVKVNTAPLELAEFIEGLVRGDRAEIAS